MKKVLLSIVLVVQAAGAQPSAPPSVVVRNCSGCHGLEGRPTLPYIPRLNGIAVVYLEKRIADFRHASEPAVDELAHPRGNGKADPSAVANGQMTGIAHAVWEEDLKTAVRWYAAQTPRTEKSHVSGSAKTGKALYFAGVPSRSLPACQECHGADAGGNAPAPRLAGQNSAYLARQLSLFRNGLRGNPTMAAVAKNLEPEQAKAVAAYLQSR